MPSYEYNEGYAEGFNAGRRSMQRDLDYIPERERAKPTRRRRPQKPKKKRTLSAWQKFMKSPKSQIKYKSGKDKGKLNLRAMGRAYRKKKKGKK